MSAPLTRKATRGRGPDPAPGRPPAPRRRRHLDRTPTLANPRPTCGPGKAGAARGAGPGPARGAGAGAGAAATPEGPAAGTPPARHGRGAGRPGRGPRRPRGPVVLTCGRRSGGEQPVPVPEGAAGNGARSASAPAANERAAPRPADNFAARAHRPRTRCPPPPLGSARTRARPAGCHADRASRERAAGGRTGGRRRRAALCPPAAPPRRSRQLRPRRAALPAPVLLPLPRARVSSARPAVPPRSERCERSSPTAPRPFLPRSGTVSPRPGCGKQRPRAPPAPSGACPRGFPAVAGLAPPAGAAAAASAPLPPALVRERAAGALGGAGAVRGRGSCRNGPRRVRSSDRLCVSAGSPPVPGAVVRRGRRGWALAGLDSNLTCHRVFYERTKT